MNYWLAIQIKAQKNIIKYNFDVPICYVEKFDTSFEYKISSKLYIKMKSIQPINTFLVNSGNCNFC